MRRRHFWAPIFLDLALWGGWLYLVFKYPPENFLLMVLFFLGFFLAAGLFLSLVFKNTRQGFLLSAMVTVFLLLRFLKMDNIVNFALLFALFLTSELYLHR